MVRLWVLLLLLWTSPSMAQIVVEASINQNQGIANQPISGSVTITHPQEEKVDANSFKLDNHPLPVTFVRQVSITADTIISIYSFELAPKEKGLYILSPISVEVGNQTFYSLSSSYEIKPPSSNPQPVAVPATPATTSMPADSPTLFKLEAFVEGPSPLYPGQRAKLVYRISFNRSIDLTHSELPLIYTTEFKKIGDEQVKDYQQGDITTQEIVQEIETSQPGTFHYGPSIIEGYAYRISSGKKTYFKDKLRAEAPAIKIVVHDFPQQVAPPSFTGAIGPIQGRLRMLTPAEIHLGDRIELELTISGPTNLAEMALPELQCQPGFSGFFQFSDLPPIANLEGSNKVFQIEMRPISTFVQAVPSIELSSFETEQGKYSFWQSESIPLKLSPISLETPTPSSSLKPLNLDRLFPSVIERANIPLAPLTEPEAVILSAKNLNTHWLSPLWVLWIIPLGGIFLLFQKKWHREWSNRQPTIQMSKQKMQLALSTNEHPPLLSLLGDAIIWRLKETGHWKKSSRIEDLPQEGRIGEARTFLLYLDSLRYGSVQSFNSVRLKQEARKIFEQIK